ncbi:MAG: ATP-dependent helicase, partial [Nitrospirae bacterium]|nr:ATP-dependent helicase [Nitrospirota bacterium]
LRYPSFVGTFDAFVSHFVVLPVGLPGVSAKPIIVDSWASLGIEVRLKGEKAFLGNGVSLDRFNAKECTIDPHSIGHAGLKEHIKDYKDDYEKAAASYRQNLWRKGFLSSADARVIALQNLAKEGWAAGIGSALAARFQEVIVDEAQDCNPLDLNLLEWLRQSGLPVTIVCDPDQAIYGFRHGNPAELRCFSSKYKADSRFRFTGNFRSSSPICSLAATLRTRTQPDDATGESSAMTIPIHVISYTGRTVPAAVGQAFTCLIESAGIKLDQAYILGHKRRSPLQSAGLATSTHTPGDSKVALIAGAVGAFWSSSGSNREREAALRDVEKLILLFMGKIEKEEPMAKAVERNGIHGRWLRRVALELIMSLPTNCKDNDDERSAWLEALRSAVSNLGLECASGSTVKSFFRCPAKHDWSKLLNHEVATGLQCATVHEAKGREYDAVCLVIPPNRTPSNHTEQLVVAWEGRSSAEALRVAYVGITRAKKLVVIAIPSAYQPRLANILNRTGVTWELRDLA